MSGLTDRVMNYIAERLSAPALVTKKVDGSVQKTAGKYTQLQAPAVSGYTFLCWVCATTNSWTGYVSPSNPTMSSVNFYVQYSQSPSTATGSISGFALYYKV